MRVHQQKLIQLMKQKNAEVCAEDTALVIAELDPRELANLFVDTTFLVTAMKFVQDQFWIHGKSETREIQFSTFVKKYFNSELEPLLFFHETLERASLPDVEKFYKNAHAIRQQIVAVMADKPYPENRIFAESALKLMSELFEFENRLQVEKSEKKLQLDFSLYRAFDSLDEVFRLNYGLEQDSTSDPSQSERLYEGSGVGVQSSYVTLLTMLRYLKISTGASFVDLGAGFGRVGLVLGLMRPDIHFQGYEYVDHRVAAANLTAKSFGVEQHVHFHSQDLSAQTFRIPEAEVYYMYDPFTDDTYQHVLAQLAEIGAKKRITVITKGNAKLKMQEAAQKGNWSAPQEFQSGNFCLFRSRGRS